MTTHFILDATVVLEKVFFTEECRQIQFLLNVTRKLLVQCWTTRSNEHAVHTPLYILTYKYERMSFHFSALFQSSCRGGNVVMRLFQTSAFSKLHGNNIFVEWFCSNAVVPSVSNLSRFCGSPTFLLFSSSQLSSERPPFALPYFCPIQWCDSITHQ